MSQPSEGGMHSESANSIPVLASVLPYWEVEGTLYDAEVVNPTRSVRVQRNRLYTTTLIELRGSLPRKGIRGAQLLYFLEMVPPEIIDHILGLLHPIDLYHLIRTTKTFRNLLLSHDATPCWRDSFFNHPDFPRYPKGCEPLRWVTLLVQDTTQCSFCKMRSTDIIEAIHLRTFCAQGSCPGSCYIVHGSRYVAFFRKILSTIYPVPSPSLDATTEMEIVSTLLTPTFRFRIDGQPDRLASPRYWKVECEETIKEYLTLKKAQLEGGDDEWGLDAFIAQRVSFVDEVHKRIEEYRMWATQIHNAIQTRQETRYRVHFDKIKTRFIAEEFALADIQSSGTSSHFSAQALSAFSHLNRTRWTRIRQTTLPILQEAKKNRLIRERQDLIQRRYKSLTNMYDTYIIQRLLLHRRRSEIPLMPVQLPLLRFKRIQDILFDESTAEVDSAVCEEVMRGFGEEVKKWKEEMERVVAGRVVNEWRTSEAVVDVWSLCGLGDGDEGRREVPVETIPSQKHSRSIAGSGSGSGMVSQVVRRCGTFIQSALTLKLPRPKSRSKSKSKTTTSATATPALPQNLTQPTSLTILHLPFSIFTCSHCHPQPQTQGLPPHCPNLLFSTSPLMGYDEISQHLSCQSTVSVPHLRNITREWMRRADSLEAEGQAEAGVKFDMKMSEFMLEFVKVNFVLKETRNVMGPVVGGKAVVVDPWKTTGTDLDELGLRFVCETCGLVNNGMRGYSWRECLRHYIQTTNPQLLRGAHVVPTHSVSSFIQLSPEATNEVKRRETPWCKEFVWACILCPNGVNTRRSYEDVKAHVRLEHAIPRPYRGLHFINRSTSVLRMNPAKLFTKGVQRTDRKCIHCNPRRKKLWSERALKSHLRYKHLINDMTERDYRVVKLLLTDPD